MSPMIRTCALMLVALAFTSSTAASAQLRRSAEGGPPQGGRRGEAVPVPRNPYAGKWEGAMLIERGEQSTPVTMSFAIVDEASQVYRGETTLGDGRTQPHVNIGTTGATVESRGESGPGILRRSPGSASESSASGPLDPNLPAPGEQALLLYHWPSRTMLLCGLDHRCGDLPALRWEEKDSNGSTWSFLAQLVAADTLAVAAVRRDPGARRETERTFLLTRRAR